MNIMIIGGGYAAQRYVESLIWDDNEIIMVGFGIEGKTKELCEAFKLPYIVYDELITSVFDKIDVVIVCVPVICKYEIVKRILIDYGYNNTLILEKPLTTTIKELDDYKKLLLEVPRCAVACQRDFLPEKYKIENADSYKIEWNSISDDLKYNIENMLPHLLSWLMLSINKEIEVGICNKKICGKIDGKDICIDFIKAKENKVIINGISYESPNYRMLNAKIVQSVENFTRNDTHDNVSRAINVSKIICKLMEEIKNYET